MPSTFPRPLAAALLLAATAACADEPAPGSFETCMQRAGGVTADMHACIDADHARADRELNAVYTQLLGALVPARQRALRTAQRDWMRFRDSNCAFRLDPMGGTLAGVAAGECQRRMTRERAAELAALRPQR